TEPAIVVVIEQLQLRHGEAVKREAPMLASFRINNFNLVGSSRDKVEFQIVVEIADINRLCGGPIGRSVRQRERAAALFQKKHRWQSVARKEHITRVVVVPVLDDHLAGTLEIGWEAGGGAVFAKIKISSTEKSARGLADRLSCQTVQLPGKL